MPKANTLAYLSGEYQTILDIQGATTLAYLSQHGSIGLNQQNMSGSYAGYMTKKDLNALGKHSSLFIKRVKILDYSRNKRYNHSSLFNLAWKYWTKLTIYMSGLYSEYMT